MNERIKQLAEQAEYLVNEVFVWDPTGPDREDVIREKFADLIVRECINNLEFHGFDDAVPYIKWMATNNLGVKE